MGLDIGSSGQRAIGPSGDPPVSKLAVFELHIEELVLHGFSARDRFAIGDAIKQELSRLIAEQALPQLFKKQVSIDRLDVSGFNVSAGAKPATVGAQLARTLHQRFSGPENAASKAHAKKGRKG
jgi:hypothetical protein